MTPSVMASLAVALLGGGLVAAVGQLFAARAQLRKARQDDERLPAEVGSLWLGGAEKAVAALQVALDRAEATIERLEAASQAKDQRITDLEHRLADFRRRLSQLQRRADLLGLELDELKDDEDGVSNGAEG